MVEREIRLAFTLTEDEFVRFQLEFASRGWLRLVKPLLLAAIALVLALNVAAGQVRVAAPVAVAVVVAFALIPALQRHVLRRMYRKQPGIQRPQTFTISESGLVNETDLGRGEARWAAFTELVELPSFHYVKFGPILGYIVPKRVFETPAAEEHFRSFVERSVAGAKGSAA
jgi:hypothetical protein